MNFDDIDTPVSDLELGGEVAPAPNADQGGEVATTTEPEVAEKPAAPEPKAAAEEPTERSPVIPRARFDEVQAKLHDAREEADRLRAELQAAKQPAGEQAPKPAGDVSVDPDVVALSRQAYAAMMDGDEETFVALSAKKDALIAAKAEQRAAENINAQLSQRETVKATQSVVSQAFEKYPFLDHEGEAPNAQAINEVSEWREFYKMQGHPHHEAIRLAVEKIGPMYAGEEAPAPATVATDKRVQAAAERNAKAASAQAPAPSAGIGNRAAPAVQNIETQSDWEKLTPAERDRLLMQ